MPNNYINESYERALLGCMLLDNSIIDEISHHLEKVAFCVYKNQAIYDQICTLYLENKHVDILALTQRCRNIDPSYIASLTDIASSANYNFYLEEVKKLYLARDLKNEVVEKLSTLSSDNVIETIHSIDSQLTSYMTFEKTKPLSLKEMCVPFTEKLSEVMKTKPEYLGVDTGWKNLNDILDGLQSGKLAILGARPSVGKTAFALQLASNLCRNNIPTDIVSLEMSAQTLMNRMVSFETGIPIYYLTHGLITSSTMMGKLNVAMNRLFNYPMNIHDSGMENEQKLYSFIRTQAKLCGTKVFIVDHIGLIRHSNANMKRVEQLDEITDKLAHLAKELDVTIVCLCQLKRDAEGKEPTLSDLRDSGAIEQNADICMFLHRNRATGNETEIPSKIIVIKHRDGACGTADMIFYPKLTKFAESSDDFSKNAA
ncbi:MAG: AAA family ATPase [Bacilli bacterium]|nr:AAA family ATPase [Bacilli bacterium]